MSIKKSERTSDTWLGLCSSMNIFLSAIGADEGGSLPLLPEVGIVVGGPGGVLHNVVILATIDKIDKIRGGVLHYVVVLATIDNIDEIRGGVLLLMN